ncbi:hypothetical protein FKW77_004213 [Venturia effusa]|uniref:Uncharacterized protein n=1 Tax=Venturia effusa TaxID=50376 RepID=A0A517LLA6_9PEZI|nr:hypothetical protein FKW77_004213 [Venturia effusa]
MLAPSWPFNTTAQYTHYLPPRPSPLSPRSANVYPPRRARVVDETMSKHHSLENQYPKPTSQIPSFSSSSLVPSSDANKTRKNAPPAFALRGGAKPNPLMRKGGDQRERRRDLFMKKVQMGREDKRWEGRSEQILRSDYILEQRRWENERARSAPQLDIYEDEEDESPPPSSMNMFMDETRSTPHPVPHQIDDEVDTIAQFEQQELEDLLALAADEEVSAMNTHMEEVDVPSSPTRYGSDEEDYDDIFMEMVSSQETQTQGQFGMIQTRMEREFDQGHEDVDMDMS